MCIRDRPSTTTGSPITPARRAGIGFVKARQAFRAVAKRLALRAGIKAKKAAEMQVASEISEIKKGDATLLEIAVLLPNDLRKKIANVRRKLTASIMALDPVKKGRGPKSQQQQSGLE